MAGIADEIKARLNIVDYVQQVVPLKRAGRTWKAPCPFHNEKTPSFVVNEDRQTWRCFGQCAEGGDIFTFAMKYHNWSFAETLQELGKLAGVEVKQRSPEQRAQDEQYDRLRGLLNEAAESFHLALFKPSVEGAAAALAYARTKRGFKDDTLYQFSIGYAPPGWSNMLDHLLELGYTEDEIIAVGLAIRNDEGRVYDRFRNRLMIPIRDERGRVTGFGARALDPDDNPKYLNSPQTALFDKSRTLFGLDAAKRTIADTQTAVIVEGYMDAIQAHQAGYKNVVAQMGTALTEAQLRLLVPRYAKTIILALDSDAAGQSATLRSLEVARSTLTADYAGRLAVEMRILSIPGAKDPDDLIREAPEQWAGLIDGAVSAADFVIEAEVSALPPNASLQQRESAARHLLPLLSASEDKLYSRDNLQKLALRLHIAERDLLAWADEQAKILRAKPPKQAPSQAQRPAGATDKASDLDSPPEPPDWGYDDAPPADSAGDSTSALQPSSASRRAVGGELSDAANIEVHCLQILLRDQKAYASVNRKLNEIANKNPDLAETVLAVWSAEDFAQPTYRAVMACIQDGLNQDDEPLYDYLCKNLPEIFASILDQLMQDDLQRMRRTVRYALNADLSVAWDKGRRGVEALDLHAELTEKALQMRAKRLQREREELFFLQTEAQNSGDSENELQFQTQLMQSIVAKGLIENALNNMNRVNNNGKES